MNQRYLLPDQAAAEREFLPRNAWWRFGEKTNLAPGHIVPAIRLHDGQSEGVMLRWGLIPSWFEGESLQPGKATVRSGALSQSKIYRMPWLSGQRCILPAAGYYVWQLTPQRYRQPFFVSLTQRSVFGIAAIWDRWVSDDDDVIESCSLILVPANELVSSLSGPDHGMPGILRRKHYESWLHGTPAEAQALLQTYRADWMHAYAVSPHVNSSKAEYSASTHVPG